MEIENTAGEDTSNTEASQENQEVETQQEDNQSSEQEETTQSDELGSDMKIEEGKEEESDSSTEEPTIDDIVAEAMTGEISEETQKLIDDNGLGKHLDLLVAGHKAIQEKNNLEVFNVVGGKESYEELQEWGKFNMDESQREAFNEALFSGNMYLAKLAVQGLNAQYVAANGKSPDRVISSDGTANADNRPFSDVGEYIKITRTSKYKRDPEYAKSVEAKRDKSGF